MKYTYKDFATGKPKWTRGRLVGWHGPDGPLNVMYAAFDRGRSMIFVPEYCLTTESKRAIDYEMKCRAIPDRVSADMRLVKPTKPRKHLFGISSRGHGYFLVATPDRRVTREALREMFIEANEEGIKKPIHVYCACSNMAGAGLDIIQVEWGDA